MMIMKLTLHYITCNPQSIEGDKPKIPEGQVSQIIVTKKMLQTAVQLIDANGFNLNQMLVEIRKRNPWKKRGPKVGSG